MEQLPPVFLQASSHPAEDVRRMIGALTLDKGGVVAVGELAVTQHGTPNMSVDVAGGRAWIPGTQGSYQGSYFCENRGAISGLTIAAAHATYGRKDLVVAKVQDSAYSGVTNSWSVAVVTGTPSASPVDPTAPANSILLARVNVAALASSITNANIDNLRTIWNPIWNSAWGVLDYKSVTANQTGITTEVDLTSLTSTLTYVANRRVRLSFEMHIVETSYVAGDNLNVFIKEGSTVLYQVNSVAYATSITLSGSVIITPSVGSHTYKLTAARGGGTGTMAMYAASTYPAWIMAEDIGPA